MANFNIFADYHTHTVFSHGKGSIEENVIEAINKGLKEIAITDHGPSHMFFGIKKSKLNEYLKEIERVKIKYSDKIKVLSGLELNICSFDGRIDLNKDMQSRFDIIIMGYHYGVMSKTLGALLYFTLLSPLNKKRIKRNTDAYINAITNNNIFAVVHPGYGMKIDLKRLSSYLVKTDTAIEINATHNILTKEEINYMNEAGVKFILSSDAHQVHRVGDFGDTIDFSKNLNLDADSIINAKLI